MNQRPLVSLATALPTSQNIYNLPSSLGQNSWRLLMPDVSEAAEAEVAKKWLNSFWTFLLPQLIIVMTNEPIKNKFFSLPDRSASVKQKMTKNHFSLSVLRDE